MTCTKSPFRILPFHFSLGLLLISVCASAYGRDDALEGSAFAERTQQVKVPEGYTVEVVAGPDLVAYPMFGTLDEDGRLFLFESTGNVYEESEEAIHDPQFRINLLEDANGDGVYDKSTIFADKVGFPQGGVFYKGSLYASSAPDLLKLTDTDGDGVADEREVLLTGWVLNINANSLIGPFMSPDGWLYMTSSIEGFDVITKEGERLSGETARIWRVRPNGSDLEWISAGGMNNPVELTFTEAAEPLGTETYFTDPKAGQRDALVYWTEGGIYPKPNENISRDNLVRTGDLMPVVSKYSRVSPAGIYRYRSTGLGDDFKDNLFSAQFNTHRVIRHRLFREGASFRTEDEVFFSSNHEDFHPTDVLEDADGSLLVVETGGWFIKGCPLSQVSKPELKGAVYRIRKTGAAKAEDPLGSNVRWSSLSPEKAAGYLDDPRPFVQDRAVQTLVHQGPKAVGALRKAFDENESADARVKAVFALYRIGGDEALEGVRSGLDDRDLQVRIAAARSVGLARDLQAVEKLMERLMDDEPAARRQAATALGQIGDHSAGAALLAAAEGLDDRFVEHAIIYALIQLEAPAALKAGLAHRSPQVRKVALIALDQMPLSSLQASELMPILASEDDDLRKSALWVASHHPEWSGEVVAFLRSQFRDSSLADEDKQLFEDILVSFCHDEQVQAFMTEQMTGAASERALFLMDTMARCPVAELPQSWVKEIGLRLLDKDEAVQSKALKLVRMRKLGTHAGLLAQVAHNPNLTPGLRLEAIAALLDSSPTLSAEYFNFLYDQLNARNEAPLRQQAASVLARGELSEGQLAKLSREFLPTADAFILPRLLPVFKGPHNSEIGKTLASTIMHSPSLDSFNEGDLRAIFAEYPEDVTPSVDQLMTKLREARAGRLEKLHAMEDRIANGDIERGRGLYFSRAACWTCHTVGAEGGTLGPDLTSIQRDRSAHDILEAIVYPSASFVREYETYRIKTDSNEYIGVIKEQGPEVILLDISPQSSIRIARKEITSMEIMDVSMMPQGLDEILTDQELADLMAFILGQDQDPDTDEAILR